MGTGKRRGVRASRIKLEAALAASDLPRKTQAALADAIADREELEAAPKDLVSKLFRELPVDPQTVERAARALGVEAATLYLADDAPALGGRGEEGSAAPSPARRRWRIGGVAAALLAIVLIGGAMFASGGFADSKVDCSSGLTESDVDTPPGKLGIVIARFSGDPQNEAQMLLARAFAADERLSDYLEVFTTCRRLEITGAGAYRREVASARDEAARDLEAVDAQLFLWGERYGDRLNVRFATRRGGQAPVQLTVDDKPVSANEIDFTLPIRLAADRPIPSSIKRVALDMMQVGNARRAKLRNEAARAYSSSTGWLRDAIISDRNLLRSISPETDKRLYFLTGNQLCYRHSLLGDIEGRDEEYARAEQVCRDVLAHVSKEHAPQVWASLQINLGSAIIRRHRFADDRQAQIRTLQRAARIIEEAESLVDLEDSPDNFATYHRNFGVTHLRLGELTEGEESLRHFERAIDLTETSLKGLSPDRRPADYAEARQNLCVLKHRLGDAKDATALFKEAIEDCRAATQGISPIEAPQGWAMAQNNLAISYALLAEAEAKPDALEQAVEEFAKAQQVYTRREYPANWAEVETNKAELNCRLALMTGDEGALRRSTAHGEAALEIFREREMDRYADYVGNLLENVSSCDPADMKSCACSA